MDLWTVHLLINPESSQADRSALNLRDPPDYILAVLQVTTLYSWGIESHFQPSSISNFGFHESFMKLNPVEYRFDIASFPDSSLAFQCNVHCGAESYGEAKNHMHG